MGRQKGKDRRSGRESDIINGKTEAQKYAGFHFQPIDNG